MFCQINGLNRAGLIFAIHVQYTKIHCMLTSRNIALQNAPLRILKISRLMKIHNLLSSLFAFFTCISKRRWIKVNWSILSADQSHITFARTWAACNSRQRAKWTPFQNAKWLFWLLPDFFQRWKNNYLANIVLQKRRVNTVVL